MFDLTLVNLSSYVRNLFALRINSSLLLPLLFVPFSYLILQSSPKFIGFFSALTTGTSTGDILSAGNRAARIRYVWLQILDRPLGSGLAPNYLANKSIADVSLNLTDGEVFASNVDSSISTPVDLAWFVGIPLLLVSIYFCLQLFHFVVFRSSRFYTDHNFLLVLTCIFVFFAMLFRFSFVNNYYFPFLPLSLSLVASSLKLLR